MQQIVVKKLLPKRMSPYRRLIVVQVLKVIAIFQCKHLQLVLLAFATEIR